MTKKEHMIGLGNEVAMAANRELIRSNLIHDPVFNSMPEGYTIIREELEESSEALKVANKYLNRLWKGGVRKDNYTRANKMVQGIRENAIHAAAEMIQTVAMCDKYFLSEANWEVITDENNGETESEFPGVLQKK